MHRAQIKFSYKPTTDRDRPGLAALELRPEGAGLDAADADQRLHAVPQRLVERTECDPGRLPAVGTAEG